MYNEIPDLEGLIEHEIRFFNRFLVVDKNAPLPKDPNKLRLSKDAFRSSIAEMQLPPAFVSAMSQLYLPSGRGVSYSDAKAEISYIDLWYVLPVRIQYLCNDRKQSHATSTAGNNQMNPVHYLHLPDEHVDIRGSQIAIMSRYSPRGDFATNMIFNFMDGRWSKAVEEPKRRLREVYSSAAYSAVTNDPFVVHTVLYTSALRWWMNALNSINEQLIAYVSIRLILAHLFLSSATDDDRRNDCKRK